MTIKLSYQVKQAIKIVLTAKVKIYSRNIVLHPQPCDKKALLLFFPIYP